MKILFIRHAGTQTNLNKLTHKKGDPAPLVEIGIKQAEVLAKVCKSEKVEKIFSSPEERAIQTAKIIANELNIESEILPGFAERNLGEWSGKPWSEIEKILNPMSIEERYTFVPPSGESWQQMETRLQKGLDHITQSKYEIVAIVTHEGALRGIMPLILNLPKEESFKYHFDNASITSFEYENNKFTEIKLNDVSHLLELKS